jgi:prophage antirepressor-like protein
MTTPDPTRLDSRDDPRFAALWFNRTDACDVLGVSHEFFRRHILERLADDDRRRTSGPGRPWQYWGPSCVSALVAHVEELRRRRRLRAQRGW